MKSFAVWFEFPSDPPATNAVRFAEEDEATAYANAKMMVWMMPTGFQVRPSEDAPNYTFGPTGLEAIS
jgi:hypothetical protein